jgi:hypothetical protein
VIVKKGEMMTMKNIAIFYHVFQTNGWEWMYQSQIHRLYASGLYKQADTFKICISGDKELPYIPEKAEIVRNQEMSSEASTLREMWQYAKTCCDNTRILYMHTKGIYNKSLQTDAWRLYMEYFLLDRWEHCLEILKSHPCCGVQLHNKKTTHPPPHFSGNMWWATSEHIASLDVDYIKDRASTEFWICSSFAPETDKPYCMHMPEGGVNLYSWLIQPKHYM